MSENKQEKNGFAIAIAWPQTYCKMPGSWYDKPASILRISKNNYYKVGHAAIILISKTEKKCHYFDFGRYHTPHKRGRVRSEFTDPDLKIKTKAEISGEKIINFEEILKELQQNISYHGDGEIHASYCSIKFELAFKKARELNKIDHILYGPFRIKANNCSRFVKDVILAGEPSNKFKFKLKFLKPTVSTPKVNVDVLHNKIIVPYMLDKEMFYPAKRKSKHFLKNVLPEPNKHLNIPNDAKWLSGEGSGSWFVLVPKNKELEVTRYSIDGIAEFKGLFASVKKIDFTKLKLSKMYYPSHYEKITLINNKEKMQFEKV